MVVQREAEGAVVVPEVSLDAVEVTAVEVTAVEASLDAVAANGVEITPVEDATGGEVAIPEMLPKNQLDPSFRPEAIPVRTLAKPTEEIATTEMRSRRINPWGELPIAH